MKPLAKIIAGAFIVGVIGCDPLPSTVSSDGATVQFVPSEQMTIIEKILKPSADTCSFIEWDDAGIAMVKDPELYPQFYYVVIHGENFCELGENDGYYHDEMCDGTVDWYWKSSMPFSEHRQYNERKFEESIDQEFIRKASPFIKAISDMPK
ncbi:MAG: hypothetical protein ABIB71_09010 [Candidatus Woesearchaeota archaeon]